MGVCMCVCGGGGGGEGGAILTIFMSSFVFLADHLEYQAIADDSCDYRYDVRDNEEEAIVD